jgi:LAO/AO transport system kinase
MNGAASRGADGDEDADAARAPLGVDRGSLARAHRALPLLSAQRAKTTRSKPGGARGSREQAAPQCAQAVRIRAATSAEPGERATLRAGCRCAEARRLSKDARSSRLPRAPCVERTRFRRFRVRQYGRRASDAAAKLMSALLRADRAMRAARRLAAAPSARRLLGSEPSVAERARALARRVCSGERVALSRGITLLESTRESDADLANELLLQTLAIQRERQVSLRSARPAAAAAAGATATSAEAAAPAPAPGPAPAPATFRVGVSGPPGAGKSSLIEVLGLLLVARGHRVAVLTVDPSSSRSGGSILGDKTRMVQLSREENAFIRTSPTWGTLGGLSRGTTEALVLCEGAGFDVSLIETVGVGQSEVEVAETVDCLLLLVAPGAGDELQGLKKGIMELADVIAVNKADGELLPAARSAKADLLRATQLIRPKSRSWRTRVELVSAREDQQSVARLWDTLCAFRSAMNARGEIARLRESQRQGALWRHVHEELTFRIHADPALAAHADALRERLRANEITPRFAAQRLVRAFLDKSRGEP